MHIKTLVVGLFEENCYIVADESSLECAIIDPGAEGTRILDYLEENHLRCSAVMLTHDHADHIEALENVLAETTAQHWMHAGDNGVVIGSEPYALVAPPETRFYAEGDSVEVGALRFTVLETPGHTPGSVCLVCENAIFTGDTLFRGSCGRTDFPLGDTGAMLSSLRRLSRLEGDYEIYPGHMGATTLERERRFNQFVLAANSRS